MEKLERIKNTAINKYHGFDEVVLVSVSDFKWLIEQAEKVDLLEVEKDRLINFKQSAEKVLNEDLLEIISDEMEHSYEDV